jgi:hypothetical protein
MTLEIRVMELTIIFESASALTNMIKKINLQFVTELSLGSVECITMD